MNRSRGSESSNRSERSRSERPNPNDPNPGDPTPPNDPNDSNGLRQSVREAFSMQGALARVLHGYEPREGQRQMSEAVASVIENGGTLLAEAETGTGKTLAYLVPSVLSGRRVLVSTGTKNLQEQIFFKDLPLLKEALGVSFTATLMKGRSNYLCLHRWEAYRDEPGSLGSRGPFLFERSDIERSEHPERFERSERSVFLPIIATWLATTETGDRAELRDLPEDVSIWKEIAADADTCLGTECPHYDGCFVTAMRRRAAEADVVIVNHHLLCADASVRQSAYGEVIPPCSTVIVDEAHQLEDVATQYFGCSASGFRVESLVRDIERLTSTGAAQTFTVAESEGIAHAVAAVSASSRLFFEGLALDPSLQAAAGLETRVRYTAEGLSDHVEEGLTLAGALDQLEAALAAPVSSPDIRTDERANDDVPGGPPVADGLAMLQRRARELCDDLRFLIKAGDPDFVYYVESRGRSRSAGAGPGGRDARASLRAAPIDVSRIIQDALFDRMRGVVLTSATVAVDGSFDYMKRRLGIRTGRGIAGRIGVRLRQPGAALPATTHPLSKDARVRRSGGTRGDRDRQALAWPRVRALHELRRAAQRSAARSSRRCRTRFSSRGLRREPSSWNGSGRPRTRCCWPPRASGRASTSSGKRSAVSSSTSCRSPRPAIR